VIAVFTKYEQFRREVMMKMEDQNRDLASLDDEVEKMFKEHYLANLTGSPPFVRLEGKNLINKLACVNGIMLFSPCRNAQVWATVY
jgi:hypothetical protein